MPPGFIANPVPQVPDDVVILKGLTKFNDPFFQFTGNIINMAVEGEDRSETGDFTMEELECCSSKEFEAAIGHLGGNEWVTVTISTNPRSE